MSMDQPQLSATSVDGRLFRYRASADVAFVPGTFVTLVDDSGEQVGQIDEVTLRDEDTAVGSGKLLGTRLADGSVDASSSHPFAKADLIAADRDAIERVLTGAGASMEVGELVGTEDVKARLLSQRFNRHTFWCGQSGSGKTYALGVVLEQLLVNTKLPVVIFDPNADFVKLNQPRQAPTTPAELALTERDIRVLQPGSHTHPLLTRFIDLPMRSKAAVLRLDPIEDRAEYNTLMHFNLDSAARPNDIIPQLLAADDAAATALAYRIENLRLIDWEIWAGTRRAVTDIIDERPDATVLDLSGFTFPDEHLAIALAVLDDLWSKRNSRRPLLIVIDEAHNLCTPDDDRPLLRAVRERITQIAAEGRKYGLWLLLSTQRPSKVHPQIISQCDNLAVMRMNSPTDLDELGTIFGYVPRPLLGQAPRLRQGEMLLAGGFVPAPMMVKVRNRITAEGGADVSVPLPS